MKNLWWQTIGTGNCHLVLLHGWGLNAEIWRCIQKKLASEFILHLVDLPGFGRSQNYGALSLNDMAACILEYAPDRAIWLGWSMGGLIASQVALTYPDRVKALVTVASSPCFSEKGALWPGVKFKLLTNFQQQLRNNFQRTLDHFLALQTIGTETALQDFRKLKQIIFSLPLPSMEVLNNSLKILKNTDLRKSLILLQPPHFRFYGYLDNLIPRNVVSLLDTLWPSSESLIMDKAAHIPFISHSSEFCILLTTLSRRLK